MKIKTVGCYVRVSTDNQLENYSIEEQIERLKAYCKAKNWLIHKIYTDGGYSGGNTDRPALKQLLQDIKEKKFELVVVYKLDRLSRSQKDTLMLIEDEFLSNNIDFVSINENFDTSTPFGRAMIGILSVFAQLEKDQITERFTMGRIGRSKAGLYHGGPTAPTGYQYVDGQLIIDQYKAEQVKEVFDRFLRGYSINSIQGYMQNKYGGWKSHSLVINVLRNSVYMGKVKFKKQEYDGVHEPIIDKKTYTLVQKLLDSKEREEKKTSSQKTPFRANYLLSSLIYCNKCGARYSGNHGYYKCYSRSKSDKKYIIDPNCKNKNWNILELDDIIISEINKMKYGIDNIDSIFKEKANASVNEKELKARIKEIDAQILKMLDLYQFNNVPAEHISARIDALQKEKDVITEKLVKPFTSAEQSKKEFIKMLNKFHELYKDGSLEERRLLVSNLIKSITIDDENINIAWRI